ncbi:MAG: exodeoxyribonuclease III [Eubacteriales bacterium]|nr:exodeoxyribonuclease III [Eubacteriales bacterium]
MYRFISWNVNGLRACLNKGFADAFTSLDADVFSIQETKMQPDQADVRFPGYDVFWNSAVKKGYSGTAVFTRVSPLAATTGIGIEEHDQEGRVITLEFPAFYLVNCYTPNSQRELTRLDYRGIWERDFADYLSALDARKPVVLCGDLNVAHQEIDLKNPSSNHHNAGFTDTERALFTRLLARGFVDSFRYLYPDKRDAYSWWSYMFNARANNAGWRIDYFLVSERVAGYIRDAKIHSAILGSDHCPVELDIDL